MDELETYMQEYKTKTLEEKKSIALEQLKLLASLTNKMCEEVGIENELFITKDIVEALDKNCSEEDFVEAVVVFASSIQNSLCDFTDKFTEILEEKSREWHTLFFLFINKNYVIIIIGERYEW